MLAWERATAAGEAVVAVAIAIAAIVVIAVAAERPLVIILEGQRLLTEIADSMPRCYY